MGLQYLSRMEPQETAMNIRQFRMHIHIYFAEKWDILNLLHLEHQHGSEVFQAHIQ